MESKAVDFVFYALRIEVNKLILTLCVGNHELYTKRRGEESMELQQVFFPACAATFEGASLFLWDESRAASSIHTLTHTRLEMYCVESHPGPAVR
jgi:hypothetical protein